MKALLIFLAWQSDRHLHLGQLQVLASFCVEAIICLTGNRRTGFSPVTPSGFIRTFQEAIV